MVKSGFGAGAPPSAGQDPGKEGGRLCDPQSSSPTRKGLLSKCSAFPTNSLVKDDSVARGRTSESLRCCGEDRIVHIYKIRSDLVLPGPPSPESAA